MSIRCVGTGVQRERRKGRRNDARLGKHSEYSHTGREERRSNERMEDLSLDATDSRFHSSFELANVGIITKQKDGQKDGKRMKCLDRFQKFHKKGTSLGELISVSPLICSIMKKNKTFADVAIVCALSTDVVSRQQNRLKHDSLFFGRMTAARDHPTCKTSLLMKTIVIHQVQSL